MLKWGKIKFTALTLSCKLCENTGEEQFAQFQIDGGNLISNATDPLGNVSTQTTDSRGNIILVAKADKDGKRLTKVTYKYKKKARNFLADRWTRVLRPTLYYSAPFF